MGALESHSHQQLVEFQHKEDERQQDGQQEAGAHQCHHSLVVELHPQDGGQLDDEEEDAEQRGARPGEIDVADEARVTEITY